VLWGRVAARLGRRWVVTSETIGRWKRVGFLPPSRLSTTFERAPTHCQSRPPQTLPHKPATLSTAQWVSGHPTRMLHHHGAGAFASTKTSPLSPTTECEPIAVHAPPVREAPLTKARVTKDTRPQQHTPSRYSRTPSHKN
jgi:hypothetical protein